MFVLRPPRTLRDVTTVSLDWPTVRYSAPAPEPVVDPNRAARKDMDEFSDLLGRARDGDREAVAALYAAYRETVLRAARSGLGPSLHQQYDTVDIGQSVFGDMLRELPEFEDRGEPAFRRWLLQKV